MRRMQLTDHRGDAHAAEGACSLHSTGSSRARGLRRVRRLPRFSLPVRGRGMGWSVNRPTGLTFHRSGLSTKGYTLLTPHGDVSAYLIDMDGRVVHRWVFEHIKPGYGRLLANGNLLMTGSDVNLPDPPPD